MLSGDLSVLNGSIHDTPNGQIQFFADPNAVHNPNTGTGVAQYPRHGQAGSRNVLRSQPYWNVDSALLKNSDCRGPKVNAYKFAGSRTICSTTMYLLRRPSTLVRQTWAASRRFKAPLV